MLNAKDLAVGGQAVIEGVMMRNNDRIATAVRRPDKEIEIKERNFVPIVKRFKYLNLPVIRGFINLLEIMFIGSSMLIFSAEIAANEDGSPEKAMNPIEITLTMLASISFSIVLFVVIPAGAFSYLKEHISNTIMLNIAEGLIRFAMFMGFLLFTLIMPDMRRVYQYHGAEHKVIHTHEAGEELTVENIKKHTTIHPRCGTSFILLVMIFSIIIFTFLGRPDFLHRIAYKIMLIPLISGLAYEVIKLSGKINNSVLKFILWPGLITQKITTREPDDDQIEVAVTALSSVL